MHCSCVRTRVLNDFCLLLAHGCGCFLANAGLINEQGRFDRSHAKMLAQAEGKVATPAALTLLTKRLKKLRTVVSQSRDKWIVQVTQLSGTECVHAAIVTGAFAGCGACFVCRPPLCPNPAMPVGDCCSGYCLLLLRRNVFLFWDSSRAGTQHEERPEQVYDEVVEAPGFRRVPRAMLVREERGTYRMRPIVGGSYVRPQF